MQLVVLREHAFEITFDARCSWHALALCELVVYVVGPLRLVVRQVRPYDVPHARVLAPLGPNGPRLLRLPHHPVSFLRLNLIIHG